METSNIHADLEKAKPFASLAGTVLEAAPLSPMQKLMACMLLTAAMASVVRNPNKGLGEEAFIDTLLDIQRGLLKSGLKNARMVNL